MGGAYRRGDLIPVFLWIEIVKFVPGRGRLISLLNSGRAGHGG